MKVRKPEGAKESSDLRALPISQSFGVITPDDDLALGARKNQNRSTALAEKVESNSANRLQMGKKPILEQKSADIIWPAFHYYAPLKKLYTYVAEHPAEALLLHHAASIAAMSRTYFAEYFHQSTGVTFKYWIDFMRVTRASTLLKLSNMSILEIADECGFFDTTTFTRTFRRIRGITPLRFRHSYRQVVMMLPQQSMIRSEHLPKESEYSPKESEQLPRHRFVRRCSLLTVYHECVLDDFCTGASGSFIGVENPPLAQP